MTDETGYDIAAGVDVPAESGQYIYILRCADGTLYTGYTTDVWRRIAEHGGGDGAKYTRGRTPVELVYVESFDSRSAAMRREHEIKQRTRAQKLALFSE